MSALLAERHQVLGDGVQIVIIEVHCGHERTGFEVRGIVDKGAQVFRRNGTEPDAIVARLARCERSGPNRPVAAVPEIVWQFDARVFLEDGASFATCRRLRGGLLLIGNPRSKFRWRVCIDADQHLGVLHSAVLRTLAEVEPGLQGSIHMMFTLLGITSIFPANRGTQKL